MIEQVISNDYDISETFIYFFANVVPNLKIISNENMKLLLNLPVSHKRF